MTSSILISDTYYSDLKGWTRKHPESWTSSDVLDWLIVSAEHIAESLGKESSQLKSEAFTNVTGDLLCKMGPEEFYKLDQNFGLSFYQQFRRLLDDEGDYNNIY